MPGAGSRVLARRRCVRAAQPPKKTGCALYIPQRPSALCQFWSQPESTTRAYLRRFPRCASTPSAREAAPLFAGLAEPDMMIEAGQGWQRYTRMVLWWWDGAGRSKACMSSMVHMCVVGSQSPPCVGTLHSTTHCSTGLAACCVLGHWLVEARAFIYTNITGGGKSASKIAELSVAQLAEHQTVE